MYRRKIIEEKKLSDPVGQRVIKVVKKCLEDDKAQNIVAIDLKGKSSIADYLIIATGSSERHISAMAGHIPRVLKGHGCKNISIEGGRKCDWVLIDVGDIIVHLFREEIRKFYNLEKIWMAPKEESVTANLP